MEKSVGLRKQQPKMTTVLPATLRMKNRELLSSLSSVSYDNFELLKTYKLQPGFPLTCPWFASLAQKFDKYKIHNLKFCYESTCPTTTPGRIIFLAYSDPNQQAPVTLYEAQVSMTNYKSIQVYNYGEFRPDQHIQMRQTEFFVRSPTTQVVDVMKYDIGIMYIYADTVTQGAVMGNIYIEYDITLMNPVPQRDTGFSLGTDLPKLNPFTALDYNYMPSVVQITDGNTINLKQAGTYMLTTAGNVGSGNVITPTFTNVTDSVVQAVANSTTGTASGVYQVIVTAAQAALAQIVLKNYAQVMNLTKVA
ncbi:putative capsid protein [Hubei zhaovirus-like virus 1]|uniref:putative capsid protein n=1 Tax=Hubei zhaovirus-like virus 1 TaxID=1923344 RepID=UPI00090B7F18|nr:putative capsid protein [Hubei zhaovirus-like virus 1]APG78150.1 putative capsid protein [Hubei zhaovirus-like virus 1]